MPQSFSRNCTVPSPMPRSSASVGDRRARLVGRHAVVLAGVDQHAVVRRRLGHRTSVGRRSPSTGRTTGTIGRLYLRANSKSRSSCAGTRHHRAGAVLAQHEVRDPDRHRLVRERIDREAAGEEAFLLRLRRSCGRRDPARGTAAPSPGTPSRRPTPSRTSSTRPCSGASITNVAPKIVSMRVVNTSIESFAPWIGNLTRAPSDRPIQFRCIVSTFSGHFDRPSAACSRSSA